MTALADTIPQGRLRRLAQDQVSSEPRYSIVSLVSDLKQYTDMRASFAQFGFTVQDCEFLYIDNTQGRQIDAYRGLNALLNEARGPIVIMCHQDIRLIGDGRAALEDRLNELTAIDPDWAVAGNAGGVGPGLLALRITDPHGRDIRIGQLPERVAALDENFIVLRRHARIGFSRDLSGFHFYGADLCLHAAQMGYASYVIDFHLEHLSPGRKSEDFYAAQRAFQRKWSRALSARWVQTTCALVHLSGSRSSGAINAIFARPLLWLARRLPGARGWKRPAAAPTAR